MLQHIFAEYGFTYDKYLSKPEIINSLVRAIKKKNDQESNDCQWILLVDELLIRNGEDFTNLCILEDIDVLVGVSPNSNSGDKVFKVILPYNMDIIAKRLVFKHRNSLELNVFLAHLNFHFSKYRMFTPMSSDEDMPLIDSCFPGIDKVISSARTSYSKLDEFKHSNFKLELDDLCVKQARTR